MDDILQKRLLRHLDRLPEDQVYRVLDYVEFLESKYGARDRKDTIMDKIADGVQTTLRATRVPAAAIRGTMGAVDSASRMMERLASAGRAAATELGRTLTSLDRAAQPPKSETPPTDDPGPPPAT